jgi:alpha-ribazole phosphatase
MLELTIVRHGETEGNRQLLYQGWTDTHLSEKGIQQAEKLALRLKDGTFDRIYSSPLIRSLKTAAIINKYHGLEIKKVDNIKEIHFGEWENMSRQQLEELYPDYLKEWRRDWRKFAAPGGESLEVAYRRINSWLNRIIGENSSGRFIIVSHAGAIRTMVSHLVGRGVESHWNYVIDNCSITVVKIYDGFPVMTLLNDVSHLEALK